VLDEPTNDLDVETLEALEQRLVEYTGTLIVVSHDRHFLDRVVTSTLVFEGDGTVHRYAGGYTDWVRLRHSLATNDYPQDSAAAPTDRPAPTAAERRGPPKKLSYKLQRELDALPDAIERLEGQIAYIEAVVNDPAFYERAREDVDARFAELDTLRRELDAHMLRWETLEAERATLENSD